MRVEYLVNKPIGYDGRQLFIEGSEFLKAKNNDDEFNSFAYATEAFFRYFGLDRIIYKSEYVQLITKVNKQSAIIITVESESQYRLVPYPVVYIANNNKYELIDLESGEIQ